MSRLVIDEDEEFPTVLSDDVIMIKSNGSKSITEISAKLPTSLKQLVITNNTLIKLPDLPPNLVSLSCISNELTSLPELPPTLRMLSCSFNKLTALPILPDECSMISCSNNNLMTLPKLPSVLVSLDCGNNEITELPIFPSGLTSLTCNDNQLTELPTLPPDIRTLLCYTNQITKLPTLPESLTELQCQENVLTELPPLPSKLTHLSVDKNNLTSLPDLPKSLENIYFDYDKIPVSSLSLANIQFLKEFITNYEEAMQHDEPGEEYDAAHNFDENYVAQIKSYAVAELVADTEPIRISQDDKVFDIIEGVETGVDEYIHSDPDNIVFYFNGKFYPFQRETLKSLVVPGVTNNTIVYSCKKVDAGMSEENLDKDGLYFRLRILNIIADYISLAYINAVIRDTGKYYSIRKTDDKIESTVSYNLIHYINEMIKIDEAEDGPGVLVSSSHCQEGQGGFIYALNKFEPVMKGGRRKSSKKRKGSRKRNSQKKQRKSRRKVN